MRKDIHDLHCKDCKSKIRDNAEYCSYCGEKVIRERICFDCGTKFTPTESFCYKCGKKWNKESQFLIESAQKEVKIRERKIESKKGQVFTVKPKEKKDEDIGIDFSSCSEGKHKLVEIFSQEHALGEETVVRWCPTCGCVVVDTDFDNRTRKGKMLVPKLAKKIIYKEDVK